MTEILTEENSREIAIEAWNMIWGRAMFAFIRLPLSWVTGYQLNDPFVTNRFLFKNIIWVGAGEIECLISRQLGKEKRPEHDFTLKLKVDLQKEGPITPNTNDLVQFHKKKNHQVLDHGVLQTGDHKGIYILWTMKKRRFLIAGKHNLVAKLEGFVPCNITNRLLEFTWTSPSSNLIFDHSAEIIAVMNSALCHGHEILPDNEMWFE